MSENRFLNRRAIRKRVPFTDRWVDKLIERGEFPKPVKLGGSHNFWYESEVDAWLAERAKASGRVVPESRPAA